MSGLHSPLSSPPTGPFELVQHLGTGGFADTYRVRVTDRKLVTAWGTDVVAIKVPKNDAMEETLIQELITSNHVKEVLREVSGAANVVRYLGYKKFDGRFVMVMEYCSGGSLRDLIGKLGYRRPVDIERTVTLAQGMLCGLSAIHRAGVFHRDIKPENILLDGGTPKIGDLGIATMLHSNEQAKSTVGTLAYMSPEILSPQGASFRSDLWSMGVTLYELLVGQWPFGDEDTPMGTMLDLIRQTEPRPPHEVRPEVPRHLSELVLGALRKDPAQRFGSAEEMAAALLGGDRLQERLRAARRLLISAETSRQAETQLRKIATDFPEDPRSHQALGEFYNRMQHYAEAIETFRHGLECDRGNAVLHWDLALAYQRIHKNSLAAKHLKEALRLGLDDNLASAAGTLLRTMGGARV